MPYSVAKKLSLGEITPTTVTLKMADRTLEKPEGIIEDVLVKVGKFIFPADFIILDMEEDSQVPLLLGRPFLATGKAILSNWSSSNRYAKGNSHAQSWRRDS